MAAEPIEPDSAGGQVWDLRTLACLQSLADAHVHHPLDRLTAACPDPARGRLFTFGSRAGLWLLADLAAAPRPPPADPGPDPVPAPAPGRAGGAGAAGGGKAGELGKGKEGAEGAEVVGESGWAAVDVEEVVGGLEEEFGDGTVER